MSISVNLKYFFSFILQIHAKEQEKGMKNDENQ